MPVDESMQLVSVDDHIIEPRNVWTDRVPARMREAAPRVVESDAVTHDQFGREMPSGSEVWVYEGRMYPQIGLNAVAGKPKEEYHFEPLRYEDMRTGCYDPVARVEDMDRDGIAVSLNFPTFPRFAGIRFVQSDDPELGLACIKAYNDFLLEEWCATAPERFIPAVILPLWDVELSIAEMQRTSAMGARAVSFPEATEPLGLPSLFSDSWDPFWSCLEETETAVCMHFGSSGRPPAVSSDAPTTVNITLMGCNSMNALAELLFSQIFLRHPTLKVALSEGGIGWIPYLLERAEYTWERHRHYQPIPTPVSPRELFAKHIWGCFIEDEHGVANRYEVGVDRIMWECDYPHSDSNWPNSRANVVKTLETVPDDECRLILEDNARALYRFPRAS